MKRASCALAFILAVALIGPGCTPSPPPPSLVLLTEESPPFNFTEGAQVTGLSTEIVRTVMQRMGIKADIRVVPWSEGYQTLQAQPGVALFSTARTPERESLFKWVGPLASNRFVLFARAGSGTPVKTLDDARKVNGIAVNSDDYRARALSGQGFTNLIVGDDVQSGLRRLLTGEADLWANSDPGGFVAAQQAGLDPADLEIAVVVSTTDLYLAFNRDTPDAAVLEWQRALDALKAEGAVTGITSRWTARVRDSTATSTPSGLVKAQQVTQLFLDGLDKSLRQAAVELGAAGIEGPAARAVLARLVKDQPLVTDASTISPAGLMTLVEPAKYSQAEGHDISTQPQVQQMLKTRAPVLSGRFMMVEGMAAVDFEYPVFSPTGVFLGSVSVIFDPAALGASKLDALPETTGYKYRLVDSDGAVLYSRDAAELGKNVLKDAPFTVTESSKAAYKQLLSKPQGRSLAYASAPPGQSLAEAQKDIWVSLSLAGHDWRLGYSVPVPRVPVSDYSWLTEDYPPFNYLENGRLRGISVDLLEQMFGRLDVSVAAEAIQVLPWPDAYRRASTEPKTAIFAIIRTPEREGLFKWVGPVASDSTAVFVLSSGAVKASTLADLRGLRVGAVRQDNGLRILTAAGFDSSRIVLENSAAAMAIALKAGKIDAFVYGDPAGYHHIKQAGLNAADFNVAFVLAESAAYFAFSKDTPDSTILAFQQALDELKIEKGPDGIGPYEKVIATYSVPRYSSDTFTAAQVTALVDRTVADIARDTPGTFRQITAGVPPYRDKDNSALYVFVYDINLNVVAHAYRAGMVGENLRGKADTAGKKFRDEILAGALRNGSGWEDYVTTKPDSSGLYYKTSYYRLTTGSDGKQYIVGAGMFKSKP